MYVCLVFACLVFSVSSSSWCFLIVLGSPFSIVITSLGSERVNLSAFHTFVQFVLVWFCLFPLPLGVWEGLQFVIVAVPGISSNLFSDMILIESVPVHQSVL